MAKRSSYDDTESAEQTTPPSGPSTPPPGTCSIAVQFEVKVQNDSPFDEIVVTTATLGINNPDEVDERSGNHYLLDPDRPIMIDTEGLHLYFKPPLPGPGVYGFRLWCTYHDAVTARTATPPAAREAA